MTEVAEVVVVGAGFAGIGAAMRLADAGIDDVVILERGTSVGGTWRDNTYPGIACDVPSHLYGFASHPNPDWSSTYASGAEIHAYLRDVAQRSGVEARIRLETPMTSAEWDDDAALWRLVTGGSGGPSVLSARALVLACGRLTEPSVPDIPGLERFTGPICHSARWEDDLVVDGARIAVVGTGASAVQLAPELVRRGAAVTLFQRTPAWIVPRGGGVYSDMERARFAADPAHLAALRAALFAEGESRFASRSGDAVAAAAAQAAATAHLAAQVADPDLRAALTPSYAFGCKRVLLSDDFYPAVASGAITLEASALASVDARGTLVAASGRTHRADALVLATGFAAARQPYAALVRGDGGLRLSDHWADGMRSFGSTVVAGFPNLFVLNGPNASLGHNSAVLMAEAQADYVVASLARRSEAGGVLRVRPGAEDGYVAEIDAAARTTPWLTGGCSNWYVDDRSGRLTLLWPGTVEAFRARLARADGAEFAPSAVRSR